jgi:tripartite-type tricarboxylate transporter receptor subunit TctC
MTDKETFVQRRQLFLAGLAAAGAFALPRLATAETYPLKPVRLVVPFGAGLSTDAIARYFAEEMAHLLGQSIVVENRAGAQGIVGTQFVATSPPDGYTLVFASNGTHAGNVAMYKKLPYDAVADFAPVGAISAAPWTLAVRNDFPAHDVNGFLEYARANPGRVSVAHGSASSHACVGLLETKGGVDLIDVPYKSLQPATIDLQGGRIDAAFLPLGVSMTAHQEGRHRVLAMTAARRSAMAPEVPAIAEFLPGYELISWVGLMAPTGTAPEVVAKLHAAMEEVLARDDTRALLTKFGHEPMGHDPAQFARLVGTDITLWRQIVADAGIELR